jgi:hypothetical protein
MRDAKPSAATWLGASVRYGLLTGGLLLFAGCDLTGQSTNPNGTAPVKGPAPVAVSDDPLKNSQIPPAGLAALPSNRAAPTNPQTPATGGNGSVPSIPQTPGTASTATLAGGTTPANPLPSEGRDLRIGSGASGSPGGSPTQLPAWETAPHPNTGQGTGSGLALTGGSGNADAFQSLQGELKRRNVIRQRLEMIADGQWKFTCTVQSPANPNLGALYESQSADPMEAIRNAIDEIDKSPPKSSTPPAGTGHP